MKTGNLAWVVVILGAVAVFVVGERVSLKRSTQQQGNYSPFNRPSDPVPPPVAPPVTVPPVQPQPATPYQAALARGRQEGKQIMLFFTGNNCRYCDVMKAQVLPDQRVSQALQRFIFCEIQDDMSLVRKYNVTGYPTFVVIDYTETVRRVGVGYKSAEDFSTWIQGGDSNPQSPRPPVGPQR